MLDIYIFLENLKDYDITLSDTSDNEQNLIYFSNEENKQYFAYSTKEKKIFIYSDNIYKAVSSTLKLSDIELIDIITSSTGLIKKQQQNETEDVAVTATVEETEEEKEDRLLKEEFGDRILIQNSKEE